MTSFLRSHHKGSSNSFPVWFSCQTFPNPLQDHPAYSTVKWGFLSIWLFCFFLITSNLSSCAICQTELSMHTFTRQYFVNADDTVPEKVNNIRCDCSECQCCLLSGDWWNDMFFLLPQVVVQKNSPRGVHFRRAGPRQRVWQLRSYTPTLLSFVSNALFLSYSYNINIQSSGVFWVRRSESLHCNLWRPLPWAQYCHQRVGVWLVPHVQR